MKKNKISLKTALFGIAIYTLSFFLKMYVLTRIWALVLVPLGLPQIDQWQAYGLTVLTSLATSEALISKEPIKDKSVDSKLLSMSVHSIIHSLVAWAIVSILF